MSTTGEWLAQQLWQLSPFLLAGAFLALSLAAAGGLYLVLARTMSVRRSVAILGAFVPGSVVFIALVVAWSSGVVVPASGPKPFEARAWQAKPWARWGMAQHLVESDRLLGMEREEVVSLLGYDDGSYTPAGVAPNDVDAWKLYRPQDLLMPIPPELVVVYRDGQVARAWIQPGIPRWPDSVSGSWDAPFSGASRQCDLPDLA